LTDISRYFGSVADVCRYFRSVADVSGYSVLVEFDRILGLVESGGFLRCGVDFGGNLRLIDLSRFLRLLFRIIIVSCKAFLLAAGGGK